MRMVQIDASGGGESLLRSPGLINLAVYHLLAREKSHVTQAKGILGRKC